MKRNELVIVGAGEFGEIAYDYFTNDSEYKVVAFAEEHEFRDRDELFSLPIIDFEEIQQKYPPISYSVFVAITYVQLNRARTRLYNLCKNMGYSCASYVSSKTFVGHNVKIGENTFVFENNTIQYYAEIGNNCVLWSGNHIGHRSIVRNNCWLTSGDIIAGSSIIGDNSFIGVNATVGDCITIAKDTVLGAGAVTVKDLLDVGCIYVGNPAKKMEKSSYQKFGIDE